MDGRTFWSPTIPFAQQLFLNRSGERFDEVALASGMAYDENGNTYAGMGIDAADVDGDNQPDVFDQCSRTSGILVVQERRESAI